MEQVAVKTLASFTGDNTKDLLDFVIGPPFVRWSLHVVPKDDGLGGAPTDPTVDVFYGIATPGGGTTFYPVNPAISSTAKTNVDNVITSEDSVTKIRVRFTATPTYPDQGAVVELYAARPGAH